MKSSKFWIAFVAAGIVANAYDFVLHGMILTGPYYSKMTELFRQGVNPAWFIFGDFLAVFVLTWFYNVVYGSFGGGAKGGMKYGLYVGILFSFPGWLTMHLMFNGFPYALAWIWTISGLIWFMLLGTVVGALYKKS